MNADAVTADGSPVAAYLAQPAEDVDDATLELEVAAAELLLVGALDDEGRWVRLRATSPRSPVRRQRR